MTKVLPSNKRAPVARPAGRHVERAGSAGESPYEGPPWLRNNLPIKAHHSNIAPSLTFVCANAGKGSRSTRAVFSAVTLALEPM